jgi:hypothetical protein
MLLLRAYNLRLSVWLAPAAREHPQNCSAWPDASDDSYPQRYISINWFLSPQNQCLTNQLAAKPYFTPTQEKVYFGCG